MKKHMTCAVLTVLIASGLGGLIANAQRGAAPPASSAAARDISGFWALSFDGKKVPTAKLVPRITKAMLDLRARRDVHAIRWCNPVGMPLMMDPGTPIEIRQGPTSLIVMAENSLVPRYIYLNRKHVSSDVYDPSTVGDSVANWEGDTLVVDTIGFHATHGVTSIPGGGFRTERTHLVERYRLLQNGIVLSVTFTWTDPTVFSTAHTYEFRYRRLPPAYEPANIFPCDPYDETRANFLGDPAPFGSEKR